jgi:hypothetical protein
MPMEKLDCVKSQSGSPTTRPESDKPMTLQRPVRVLVAVCLLQCSFPCAQGGELFKSFCHDGKQQHVTLPGRDILIEQDQPRVTIRETTARVKSRAGFAAVGAVYMPMAFPMMGFGAFPTPSSDGQRGYDAPLTSTHRALAAALDHEHAEALLRAEIDVATRALQRMASPPSTMSKACPSTDSSLQDLRNEIAQLKERMSDVERLLLYHDNAIRGKAANPPGSPSPAMPPVSNGSSQ